MNETNGTLAQVDAIRHALMQVRSVNEVLDLRDRVAVLQHYLQLCRAELKTQNAAAELKIRCERRLGELLGDPKPPGRPPKMKTPHDAEFLINSRDAARLRKIASVPEGELIAYIHTVNEEGLELTTAGVLRLWRSLNKPADETETETVEIQPEPEDDDSEPVHPEFWKSANTCRDEVRRCARKLRDIRTVLSGLADSPYLPLVKKAAHKDPAVKLDWDGETSERSAPLGATLVSKTYTCPAIESLTKLVAGLELLFDREVGE